MQRLSSYHKSIRLVWAREVKNWDKFKWHHIIWSDEIYVYVGGVPKTVYVTHAPDEVDLEEYMAPHFKQSNVKVMVWACIM